MKKYLLAVMGASLLFSTPVFAAGYGDAGCGLGSLVFGDSPGLVQVFAATTNGTSYSQALGITSGTSNCNTTDSMASREMKVFVKYNFESLEKEMATGSGEHLMTLAGLLGCPASEVAQFGAFTQQNYETLFTTDSIMPSQLADAVQEGVLQDPALSTACIR